MSVLFLKEKTKKELENIIKTSTSKQEVLRKCNIDIKNSTAKKWLNNFIVANDIDIKHFSQGIPSHKKYSYEMTYELVKNNICWSDLIKGLGLRFSGNNIKTAKNLIKFYNLDTSHFDAKKASVKNNTKTRTFNEIFCESSEVSRSVVKQRIISKKLIEYKCNECELTDNWNNKPLVLHLEHKNGIGNDNRLENLCFLCPNCHSQTNTFAGRNVLGKKRRKDGSFYDGDDT